MIGVTEPTAAAGEKSAVARRAMIDGQLRVSGVNDPIVIDAMDKVPREIFLPAERRAAAYVDRALPLGHGRMLAPPLSYGKMLVEARVTADDDVLIIGGGTGYLAALVAPLVHSLTVVESEPELAAMAPSPSGQWVIGPLTQGAPDRGPYSLILIDGTIEQLPNAIADQLADGGRVVTGLVDRGVGRLAVGRKAAGRVAFLVVDDAEFPPLPEFRVPRGWSF